MEGLGTVDKKVKLIAELLTSASQEEAKYIIRTLIGELRVGLGEGTIRDAIVWAFFEKEIGFTYEKKENNFDVKDRENYNSIVATLQEGYDILNDFADVALIAKESGLKGFESVKLEPGKPIKVMLAQKVKDVKEGFEKVGVKCAAEYKYDGFRIQIHKHNGKIILYTRRLENVTNQFPEVVSYIKEYIKGDSFILDSEAVGYEPKTGKYIAFQKVSQRIKRKYDIEKMAIQFPVEVNIFDVVSYEGKNYIQVPFFERRELLAKIVSPAAKKIRLAEQIVSDSEKDISLFYKRSLEAGNEGIMMKTIDAPYKPGSRVGYIVKLKPVMETLDLVIVGAEWGEGKRSEWLSSFIVACRDSETGEYLEIGRVGTGIKEKEEEGVSFMQLTEMLKPLVISEKGKIVMVRPEIVIEINYEEIQKSPTYESGYALRFPRLIKIREDRRPDEINSLEEVEKLYFGQRGRNK
jgi:DNA ligase-1